MITFADKSMFPELIKLWEESFGDSKAYIQMFLDWNFNHCKTIVFMVENKPVSVAYLLPIEYTEDLVLKKGWYLYAAATLPAFRGYGYFSNILSFVQREIAEPVILVPAEKSLISYYQKQELTLWLSEHTCMIKAGQKNAFQLQGKVLDISEKDYICFRNQILSKKDAICWGKEMMSYIFHENDVCGGQVKQVILDLGENISQKVIVMYRKEKSRLKILEILPQNHIEECTQLLLNEIGCEIAEICIKPPVMATKNLSLKAEQGYFNLIMG